MNHAALHGESSIRKVAKAKRWAGYFERKLDNNPAKQVFGRDLDCRRRPVGFLVSSYRARWADYVQNDLKKCEMWPRMEDCCHNLNVARKSLISFIVIFTDVILNNC